jgi:hypothetical protein
LRVDRVHASASFVGSRALIIRRRPGASAEVSLNRR